MAARLSPLFAQRIAAAVNTSVDFWMSLQQAVDLFEASRENPNLPLPLPEFRDR